MRKLILALFVCLLAGSSFGQKDKHQKLIDKYTLDSADRIFPEVNGVILYTGVVEVDSVKKDELFNRAKAWFVTEYKSANDVLQMQDKEAGIIIGKGLFEELYNIGFMVGYKTVSVYHTVKIYVKDGKYKYEITDLNAKYYQNSTKYTSGGWNEFPIGNVVTPGNKKNYRSLLENCNIHIMSIIQSLKTSMEKPISTNF